MSGFNIVIPFATLSDTRELAARLRREGWFLTIVDDDGGEVDEDEEGEF